MVVRFCVVFFTVYILGSALVAAAVPVSGDRGEEPGSETGTPSFSALKKNKRTLDFHHLDDAQARADACEGEVRETYSQNDNKKILSALNGQAKCLEVLLFSVAREFYDVNAFGTGGLEARIAELRKTLGNLYATIYSEPRTCAPNCGEVYQVWAAEAYVNSIRIMLDDMIERLKDESPLHQP